jgi:hypothetical protein
MGQAKTQTNSLFLHMLGDHVLVISQYIPLPAFKDLGTKSEFDEFFNEARTPIFMLIFIGVLLVQIFYRQKKMKAE